MGKTMGIITAGIMLFGCEAGGEPEPGYTRDPYAVNVVLEKIFDDGIRSDERIAGLGLAIAEDCVVLGFVETEDIEAVPLELQTAEFYKGYRFYINSTFDRRAIEDTCRDAVNHIKARTVVE